MALAADMDTCSVIMQTSLVYSAQRCEMANSCLVGVQVAHTVLRQLYIENQKHIPNFWI